MNHLTALEWSLTTIAAPFRFQVTVGLKLAAQRARAKQNRAMGSPWRQGWRWRWSGVRSWRCTWRKRCARSLETRTTLRTRRTSPLSKKVRCERGWRGRGRAQGRGRGIGRGNAVDGNATSVGNNDAQPLTWDVLNLAESKPREPISLRELDAHFPSYCKPEREFNFFKLLLVEQVSEAFFRVHEGVCDRRPNFAPQFGEHFILENWWAWPCWKVCGSVFQNIIIWVAIWHFASQKSYGQ